MTKNNFRSVFAVSILLGIAPAIIDSYTMPAFYRDLIENGNKPVAASSYLQLIGDIFFIVAGVVSTVGIFIFKAWSRPLLIAFHVLAYALIPFHGGVMISTALGLATAFTGCLLTGTIIALSYTSPIKEHFKSDMAGGA